ncbi:MAG TPA: type II secretion system F family protein [Gemmatimonadales bacterium]|nr:type II secretion system F family protein [Gemmatimonadales bacterium]
MLLLIVALAGIAVFALAIFLIQLAPAPPEAIRRLEEMGAADDPLRDAYRRRARQERSERLKEILAEIGGRMETRQDRLAGIRKRMVQAGYTSPGAGPLFLGLRLVLSLGLALLILLAVTPVLGLSPGLAILGSIWGFGIGWLFPGVIVSSRTKKRQKEMIKALPDALDLLVVCVEAGLGLNQAMVRVAQEIGHVSQVLGEQLELTNLEIRAGTPRDEALRNLGERTGVEDIMSFVSMLIQTDRFGTSIADALRVHSDVLRTKRRQRAEEAAAKTAIKMLFPLVFFIFPAMFVVILGPAVIQVIRGLSGV